MENKPVTRRTAGQLELLGQKRFLPFFVTQFLGAFNDNIFKTSLIILLTYQSSIYSHVSPNILIPLSIYSTKNISPLEATTIYLKEELK